MTKRQLHQVTRDRAEQRKRHNDTQPIGMDRRETDAGQEDVLAAEQWDEIIRLHIPGIALSGMPRIFELPVVLNGRPGVTSKNIGDRATDQSRWSEIPNVLIAAIQEWDREAPTFSDGWTYESIIPANTVPDPNDEPNPRTYTLSGQLIRTLEDGNAIRMKVCSAFDHRLSELFRLSPNNTRERHVTARLQHHFDRGGNPTALLDYAEGLAMRWEADPPTYHEVRHYLDNNKRYPTVADSHILTRAIRQWVEDARKMTASARGTSNTKRKRPDLKLLALVHALRYLTGDKSADITQANAQGLAMGAQSAGRELYKHYTGYTLGKNAHNERLGDGAPHTVKRRYLAAIEKLEDFPKALAMAERELEKLHERE